MSNLSINKITNDLSQDEMGTPAWLTLDCMELLIQGGSHARGVDVYDSDIDLYGIVCPPRTDVFPHQVGHVIGFGPDPDIFTSYSKPKLDGTDYTFHSLVRFVHLLTKSHPDMVALLHVDDEHLICCSQVGHVLRDNRAIFISREMACRQRDMAKQQLQRAKSLRETTDPRKILQFEQYGYSTKTAYHAVRLLIEANTMVKTGSIHLKEHANFLLSIREGTHSYDEVVKIFSDLLVTLNHNIEYVQPEVDFERAKKILWECLEIQYGVNFFA